MQVDATAFDELTLGVKRDVEVELHSCRSIFPDVRDGAGEHLDGQCCNSLRDDTLVLAKAPLFRNLERTGRNCQSLNEFRRASDLLQHGAAPKKSGAGPVGMAPNRVDRRGCPSWTTGICRSKV
jgi:hypothetical protein